jgi:hypothetical protein
MAAVVTMMRVDLFMMMMVVDDCRRVSGGMPEFRRQG